MSLTISYKIAKDKDEAMSLAKEQITAEYVAKFKVKADISYDEDKRIIKAKGKGFELFLTFEDTQCIVDISLSLLLRALKGKVLEAVDKKIRKHL